MTAIVEDTKMPNFEVNKEYNVLFDYYTLDEMSYLHKFIFDNPSIKTKPFLAQMDILAKPKRKELIYGSAGLGKSFLQLMESLKYVNTDEYEIDACLIRNNYTDLANPGGMLFVLKKWFRKDILYNKVHWDNWNKQFTFPNGSTLTFQYLDNEGHLDAILGTEYQFIGVDEAVRIKENFLDVLPTRLRGGVGDYIHQLLMTTNSFGTSSKYLLDNYINGDKGDATYVDVTENPYQTAEYIEELDNLPPFLKAIYRKGDFEVHLDDGLLITKKRLESRFVKIEKMKQNIKKEFKIGVIDGAGEGVDKVGCAVGYENDTEGVDIFDTFETDLADYDEVVFNFFDSWGVKIVYYEYNGGADSYRAYKDIKKFARENYEDIEVKKITTKGKSKFIRCKPWILSLHRGESFIADNEYTIELMEEILTIHPDKAIMQKQKSPNMLDACAYIYQKLVGSPTRLIDV